MGFFRKLRGSSGGQGRGRMGGTQPGAGPDGECVCPQCGHRMAHQVAQPCYKIKCPQCGSAMRRA
jgi:PHP family Zn ribbon phosphoesterase